MKALGAFVGIGAVLLSLVFTIQPAWHLLEKGHTEGALLWAVWGLFWTAFWFRYAVGLQLAAQQQADQDTKK
jgi:hypothetical protein